MNHKTARVELKNLYLYLKEIKTIELQSLLTNQEMSREETDRLLLAVKIARNSTFSSFVIMIFGGIPEDISMPLTSREWNLLQSSRQCN